jgi:N-acetylmuramoyl-L-alanine amidase
MVGGPWDGPELDGVIWQWMSLDREADANLDANRFAISIETSDNAPRFAEDLAPWSPKQLVSLVRLGNWLAERFDIPRRQCPAWDAGGFGWHAMWGAPSHWTPSAGKVCPGSKRIHQLKTIVLPAIFAGRDLEEDDVLDQADKDWLEKLAENVARRTIYSVMTGGTGLWANPDRTGWEWYTPEVQAAALVRFRQAGIVPGTTTPDQAYEILFTRVRNIEDMVETIEAKVEELAGDPAPEPPPVP